MDATAYLRVSSADRGLKILIGNLRESYWRRLLTPEQAKERDQKITRAAVENRDKSLAAVYLNEPGPLHGQFLTPVGGALARGMASCRSPGFRHLPRRRFGRGGRRNRHRRLMALRRALRSL